jgi:hypothetical protein
MLIWTVRAYDTGSERIWNSINKGVRRNQTFCIAMANEMDSGNGRTSSTGSWSSQRTTSRAAAAYQSSECNTGGLCEIGGWALYIESVFYRCEIRKHTVLTTTTQKEIQLMNRGCDIRKWTICVYWALATLLLMCSIDD